MMLWHDLLSSNHTQPCPPQAHQAAGVSSPPHANSSSLVQSMISSPNGVLQSSQLGGIQISPVSSSYHSETQGQLQHLLSPPAQAGGLPSLPKLTPLPSQPPMLGSHQAPPTVTVSTPQTPPTVSAPQCHQFGGFSAVPPTDNLMSKSVPLSVSNSAPQQSTCSTESTLNAQNSINLLSILNSLSPSQLESLLNSTVKDSQQSPMSASNGRQVPTYSSIGNGSPAVPNFQTTVTTNFPNQNFGSSIPPSLHHHSLHAANGQESLASHDVKPKVVQVNNKTAASAALLPQFTVRSSCTSTELRGQLLQFEPTAAAMQGYNSNATAGPVSALRLHSHQIN